MTAPVVSVVIPTRNRPELLRRCLRAVLDQRTAVAFDVVVVNDRGCPVDAVVAGAEGVRLIEGPGRGPAAARNAGIAAASGDIVLFTDDDAVPQPGWIDAAVTAFRGTPGAVGVAGRVESPPFDPLYEHSVRNDGGTGNFLTCNIAYRRSTLEQLGGFDEGFPFPAAEDRDLGYRGARLGPVVYEPAMVVVHPPRPIRVTDTVRRARFLQSEWRLHAKHPQTRPPRWSARSGPLIRLVRHWQRLAEDGAVAGSPRRAARFAAMAGGQIALATWLTVRGPERVGEREPVTAQDRTPGLRIAWIGPTPVRGGGVAGVAWQLVDGLGRLGCEVDCFLTGNHEDIPGDLWGVPQIRVVNFDTGWRFDRWYSNAAITKVLTGLAATAWGRRRLASLLVEQHRRQPYDVVYQFSTIELFGLRRSLPGLPPLVIHPETHAAGELRSLRAERHLASRCEPWWRRHAVEVLQAQRARRQRRDIAHAARVVAISRRFGEHLVRDYCVDPARLVHAPNPIDLEELPATGVGGCRPQRVAFVGRISVRKGVDAVVELSRRLGDLDGEVALDIVGAETLWSDYRPLLADLNPAVARYRGYLHRAELAGFLASADVLLQPSTFEPFGLTVGEALACGAPVVATDEVGAAEDVDERCCIVVPAGDVDALEKGVREMLAQMAGPESAGIRRLARAEAERLFAPGRIAALVHEALAGAAKADRRAE